MLKRPLHRENLIVDVVYIYCYALMQFWGFLAAFASNSKCNALGNPKDAQQNVKNKEFRPYHSYFMW